MIKSNGVVAAISVDALQAFCERVLVSLGATPNDAQTTADVLVTTDTWGVHTHGTKLLRGYVRRIRGGGLRVDRSPQLVEEGAAWGIVDGQSTLGQVTATFAMQHTIAKAREVGIAYVGVRNSCHFGAAGYYAWLAARENMIGLAMSNDIPSVAAPGSRGAVIGSNPIAYAVAVEGRDPMLFDISIATVAGSKVYARCARGEPIPTGWLIGPDGLPTCDGTLFPSQASLAPMSGHKGYGIGLLIETLSGVLTGAGVTRKVRNWMRDDSALSTNHGAAFIAINLGAMVPRATFQKRISAMIDEIHAAEVAEGSEGVLMPGEREWNNRRDALANGLYLPVDVAEAIEELAVSVGLDPFS